MTIHFINISSQLGTRIDAAKVRASAAEAMRNGELVTFDFSGVNVITNSFADECFGKLLLEFDLSEIKQKSRIVNASEFVGTSIASAVNNRIASLQVH